MTVNTITTKVTYLGDGATTAFSFSFALTGVGDIQVITADSLGHQTTIPTNQYSIVVNPVIAPNPTPIGGIVTYPLTGPPLAIGNSITVARVLVENQPTSISNQSIVYPPVMEQTFDRLTMMDQQVTEQVARSILVPIGDPNPPPLPPAALRANTQAVFDSSGNMTAGGAVVGTIISAVMIPVVTAPTLPLARTAMAVPGLDSPAFTGTPTVPTATVGDSSNLIADTSFVMTAIAANGVAFTTGDMKPTHKTVADPNWILWTDGTIGDATSGASVRANADTHNLFNLYYNGYSDTLCPLLTSTGAATTRAAQGTAAAAYAAHCQVNLPKGSGRGVGNAGAGSGLTSRTLGSTFGAESVTMTVAQMPVHNHPAATSGAHAHSISDPSHVHALADPGHTHGVADPGHVHSGTTGGFITFDDGAEVSLTMGPGANAAHTAVAVSGTGISIYAAGTGMGVYGAFTGINSTNAADIGINTFNTGSGSAMNVMNPMAYINWMIKL